MMLKGFVREELVWVGGVVPTPGFWAGMALAALWVEQTHGVATAAGGALLGLAAALLVMALVDMRYRMMPLGVNIAISIAGLAAAWAGLTVPLAESVGGFVAAFGGLWACAALTEKLTGKESLGGADVWLIGGLGAWGGIWSLPMLLVGVSLLGIGVVVFRAGAHKRGVFAFGPILILAGWVSILHSQAYWQTVEAVVRTLADRA